MDTKICTCICMCMTLLYWLWLTVCACVNEWLDPTIYAFVLSPKTDIWKGNIFKTWHHVWQDKTKRGLSYLQRQFTKKNTTKLFPTKHTSHPIMGQVFIERRVKGFLFSHWLAETRSYRSFVCNYTYHFFLSPPERLVAFNIHSVGSGHVSEVLKKTKNRTHYTFYLQKNKNHLKKGWRII